LAAYPSLAPLLPSCVFAVSSSLVTAEEEALRALQPSEEVALIPPVSGG
jgi:molybdopterin converting factor small subunit